MAVVRADVSFMKKNMATSSQWRQQERLFEESAPFIHLYTSPLETSLLMENDEDRTAVLNMIALTSAKARVGVLAYALMSNHLHLLLRGDEVLGRIFYEGLQKRLSRYLAAKGKTGCIREMTCGITPITSLRQFRDELAYIIRNPYVVREDVNLLAYRWCSGYLYFNPFISTTTGTPAGKIGYRNRRLITHSSAEELPESFRVEGNLILPESFVDYPLVEALFGTARQFLFCVLRNVEAQVLVSQAYHERPMVSDDELFILSRDLCEKLYGTRQPKDLSHIQKKEFAVSLRQQYHASNGQLARLTTLDQSFVNDLYPLTAKC